MYDDQTGRDGVLNMPSLSTYYMDDEPVANWLFSITEDYAPMFSVFTRTILNILNLRKWLVACVML